METVTPASQSDEIGRWADTTITEEEKTMMVQHEENNILEDDVAAGVLGQEGEKERESPERANPNPIIVEQRPLIIQKSDAKGKKLPPLPPQP